MSSLDVIIPTHNPHPGRLRATLEALHRQSLPVDQWEIVVVDNASDIPLTVDRLRARHVRNLRVVPEPALGLTAARRRGLTATDAPLVVFVDDDNVLERDYLAHVVRRFTSDPTLGALGGKSIPVFETEPEPWVHEFLDLIACRDLGPAPLVSTPGARRGGGPDYPAFAPIGAGMAIRRAAIANWIADASSAPSDRRGSDLSSSGDNDLVFAAIEHGWSVGYFPELVLEHLIPASRLDPRYIERLNRGIQKSWMQVLTRHHANPWAPIASWTSPWRKAKAWIAYRAWSGPAARIRWQGACGHFEGRTQPRAVDTDVSARVLGNDLHT